MTPDLIPRKYRIAMLWLFLILSFVLLALLAANWRESPPETHWPLAACIIFTLSRAVRHGVSLLRTSK
ncbi:MAG: hypothetical protein ABL931_12310 [Usitatibacteraceae bacterium]